MQTFRFHFVLIGLLVSGMAATKNSGYVMPNTRVIPIQDTANNKAYELYVKLPDNYAAEQDKTYPVIYYTDAVWHIEGLSAATAFLLEDVILVGISWQLDRDKAIVAEVGPYVSRFSDYSIRSSSDPERQAKYQFGQAKNHLAFIRQEVISYVEKRYRTDPKQRTYFGYSLGGLFGAYVLAAHPDTFKNYIIGSPSLQRDNPTLADLPINNPDWSAQVYITRGTEEQDRSEPIATFSRNAQARFPNVSITSVVIDGTHQTAFPATAVQAIVWLEKQINRGSEP